MKFKLYDETNKKFVKNFVVTFTPDQNGVCDFFSAFDAKKGNQEGEIKYKLLRYTGLNDCNGAEIYEGDLVDTPDDGQFEVVYSLGAYIMEQEDQIECQYLDKFYFDTTEKGDICRDLKVVGSAYDTIQ